MKWRNEFKYFVSDSDINILKHRLEQILQYDSNSNSQGFYTVRSLYFDDPFKSGIFNKLDGVRNRVRYRIRRYDDSNKLRLEAKLRSNQAISKVSKWLSMDEYASIIDGGVSLKQYDSNNVYDIFLLNIKKYHLRPSVIVEYDRVAFIVPGSDVRITLDLNVRSFKSDVNLINPIMNSVPVLMYPKQQILEVKFTDKIPSYIKQVVQSINIQRYAISKYTLCTRYIRNNSWEDN